MVFIFYIYFIYIFCFTKLIINYKRQYSIVYEDKKDRHRISNK